MSQTTSEILPAGSNAPPFLLPDGRGTLWSFNECAGANGTLIVFASNHCPFVTHIASTLGHYVTDWRAQGIEVAAICSSDISVFPEDAPEHFAETASEWEWDFPYLWDQTQGIARVFRARCTPELFLYDCNDRLYYHGRFDESLPGGNHASGLDLAHAIDSMCLGRKAPDIKSVTPIVGSSISWLTEPIPHWASAKQERA